MLLAWDKILMCSLEWSCLGDISSPGQESLRLGRAMDDNLYTLSLFRLAFAWADFSLLERVFVWLFGSFSPQIFQSLFVFIFLFLKVTTTEINWNLSTHELVFKCKSKNSTFGLNISLRTLKLSQIPVFSCLKLQ